jgi:hypothetical protein
MTTIRKQTEREFVYTPEGEATVQWQKGAPIPVSEFWRELARFVDWERRYWHAMDCTRDLVLHVSPDGETYILGKVSA